MFVSQVDAAEGITKTGISRTVEECQVYRERSDEYPKVTRVMIVVNEGRGGGVRERRNEVQQKVKALDSVEVSLRA